MGTMKIGFAGGNNDILFEHKGNLFIYDLTLTETTIEGKWKKVAEI